MIPEDNSTIRPLGTRLSRFFQLSWTLISEGSVGIRQQVITRLASEGGLARIKELTETRFDVFSDDLRALFLKDFIFPFFCAISHQDVLSSLLLESALDTIYNFLFGPSGRRLLTFFGAISSALPLVTTRIDEDLFLANLEASLVVLQKLVDLNGTALILDELHSILSAIGSSLNDYDVVAGSAFRAHQSFSRIQRRLDQGSAISKADTILKRVTDPQAMFELHQDMPGMLSREGPRHDNDHDDITKISIMPTAQEIQSSRSEYLPYRDPSTLHLPGIKGLLDRQFRLLREDSVGQLRDAVGLEMERLRRRGRAQHSPSKSRQGLRTFEYRDVHLIDIKIDKFNGLEVLAKFVQPAHLLGMKTAQRRDWWSNSRYLQLDSLLCLVDSDGGTLFLSAAEQIEPASDKEPEALRSDGVWRRVDVEKTDHKSQFIPRR